MAHGLAENLKSEKYNFYSAGTKTHGLNPNAVIVMNEIGIDISHHTSNLLSEYSDVSFDTIFTVCAHANDNCPYVPGANIKHVGFDDPPTLTKDFTDAQKTLDVYRRVRDEIKDFVVEIEKYLEK